MSFSLCISTRRPNIEFHLLRSPGQLTLQIPLFLRLADFKIPQIRNIIFQSALNTKDIFRTFTVLQDPKFCISFAIAKEKELSCKEDPLFVSFTKFYLS